MKKRIIIEVESESDKERIETYLEAWIRDNFRFWETVKIKVEDVE